MEQPTRSLMIICTAATGASIILGFMMAIYASTHSPNIQDVPIYENGIAIRRQSKDVALFGPLLLQIPFFAVQVYCSVRWKRFLRKAIERTALFNAQRLDLDKVDLSRAYTLVCYGIMVMAIFGLLIVAYTSFLVLNI